MPQTTLNRTQCSRRSAHRRQASHSSGTGDSVAAAGLVREADAAMYREKSERRERASTD